MLEPTLKPITCPPVATSVACKISRYWVFPATLPSLQSDYSCWSSRFFLSQELGAEKK